MTISISGGLLTETAAIANTSVTTIFTAERRTMIVSVIVTPTSGTPNLSLSRYDGTTRRYFRRAVTMTAGTAFAWEVPFMVDAGDVVEVTSSAAGGDMDVMITYLNPVAPATVRASA
jgi:hypothetical protein